MRGHVRPWATITLGRPTCCTHDAWTYDRKVEARRQTVRRLTTALRAWAGQVTDAYAHSWIPRLIATDTARVIAGACGICAFWGLLTACVVIA